MWIKKYLSTRSSARFSRARRDKRRGRARFEAPFRNRVKSRSLPEASMFPPDLITRAAELLARYKSAHHMIATAESCTGGLIAALLTEIPGSSDVVERGFIVYSNAAKEELLSVPA